MDEQRVKFEKSYAEWEFDQDERSPVSYRNAYAAGYGAAWAEREATWRAVIDDICDTAETSYNEAILQLKELLHSGPQPNPKENEKDSALMFSC